MCQSTSCELDVHKICCEAAHCEVHKWTDFGHIFVSRQTMESSIRGIFVLHAIYCQSHESKLSSLDDSRLQVTGHKDMMPPTMYRMIENLHLRNAGRVSGLLLPYYY